ncbi:uncharacterized protein LOC128258470 [Drosophila gunungcola]|uniref:uncharacterized protein LOC128258470 n=1 Tax=Drosophila gunungcola TaxID=103775 RepID=UPI0022E165A7|nr:uncharacterized protein LOC128258470 [Drosophila gunungcola]
MICLSRLVIINLPSVWPPKRSSHSEKKDSNGKISVQQAGLRDFQRPLQFHTKRDYIKWFSRLSRCHRAHHFPGRMHSRF